VVAGIGTPGFRDDARQVQVRLGELGLRLGEKFTYTYNYFAGWRLDLRVEHIGPTQPGRVYPRCTGGRRACPPEDWDGPWAFAEQTQPYLVFDAMARAAQVLSQLLAPTQRTTWPGSVRLATSWPACCRCWAWSASTAGLSTMPWLPAPRTAGDQGMKLSVQVIIHSDDDAEDSAVVRKVFALDRDGLAPDTLGLRLAEAKDLLAAVQNTLVSHQVSTAIAAQVACPDCGQSRRHKDSRDIVMTTLFGRLRLASPRWWHCRCRPHDSATFSPLAALLPRSSQAHRLCPA
jgi:hypothetical protein